MVVYISTTFKSMNREWLTTRNAVLRWIESSSENNILAKANAQLF